MSYMHIEAADTIDFVHRPAFLCICRELDRIIPRKLNYIHGGSRGSYHTIQRELRVEASQQLVRIFAQLPIVNRDVKPLFQTYKPTSTHICVSRHVFIAAASTQIRISDIEFAHCRPQYRSGLATTKT